VINRARSPQLGISTRIRYYHKNLRNASFGPPPVQIPGSLKNNSRLSDNGNSVASSWHLCQIDVASGLVTGICTRIPVISRLNGNFPGRPARSELPPPPRTPAQFRFPGAPGIVFDFPRLCHRRHGNARSLPAGIGQCRQKCPPSLWPRQTFSCQEFVALAEIGSNVSRDRFESRSRQQRRGPASSTVSPFL
jgi:hypothetical protein